MAKQYRKVKLLAPAGSKESLIGAVLAGADEIYIGGSKFGARAYAGCLDEENLEETIDYVHLHNRQIYLTVNTLLKNKELEEELYRYLVKYYEAGIDAVIVQDMGVMRFINTNFSDLPIHASTQMSLTTAEGANLLKDFGVTRIVTSRELLLEEIKTIRENTNLEIESFIHGALCYCYSGQCLFSSMIGTRSGNRGRCAQPCRMPYKVNKEEKYLLSPKDICTLDILPELMKSGIDSFKIEGRMKRPEYTALTVSKYKKYMNLYEQFGEKEYVKYISENALEFERDKEELMDLYNRGNFTTGYYKQHNNPVMMSMKRPNHNGVLVGKVTNVKGIRASIVLQNNVNAQDVLEIRNGNESIYEFTVKDGRTKGEILESNVFKNAGVAPAQNVYRTKNSILLQKIREQYIENKKRELISGKFIGKIGMPMKLIFSNDNVEIEVSGDIVQEAMKQPTSIEKINAQLDKIGETEFQISKLDIEIDENIFLPNSQINGLRREAIKQLEKSILVNYKRKVTNTNFINKNFVDNNMEKTNIEKTNIEKTKIAVTLFNTNLIDCIIKFSEVDLIYLNIDSLDFGEIYKTIMKIKESKKSVYIILPVIFRKDIKEKFDNNMDLMNNIISVIDGVVVKNIEEIDYVKKYFSINSECIIADYNLYTMNKESKQFLKQLGISKFTAPIELSGIELKEVVCNNTDIIVYGHTKLMVSAQCIKKNTVGCIGKEAISCFKDKNNNEFYARNCCGCCYNIIYDSKPLSLLSNSEDVLNMNPRSVRLDFTIETKKEVEIILKTFIDLYRYGNKIDGETFAFARGHWKRPIE